MKSAQLVYSILCDDVRLELGNKLSLMGIFENIFLQSFPAGILRFATVNHWVGVGDFETQVRVVAPDGHEIAASAPSAFRIESQGYADNITFFANVALERAGTYHIRTYLDGKMVYEKPLFVRPIQQASSTMN
jgi:hypothetical protein